MIEAIVLNPPTTRRGRLSAGELEALAGWPNSRRTAHNPKRRTGRMARAKTARGRAWQSHVAKFGGDFRAAARSWKSVRKPAYAKNTWVDDAPGHRKAAKKSARRKGVGFHSWMQRLGRKGGKKRWSGKSKAARSRFMRSIRKSTKRRGGKRRVAANILTNILTNKPRRRGGRSYRRNILTNPFTDTFKELFNKENLLDGAMVASGALGAIAVPNLLMKVGPIAKMTPTFLKSGWGSYALGLVAGTALAGLANYFGKKRLGRNLLIGTIAGTVGRVVGEQLAPKLPAGVSAALTAPGKSGMGADVDAAVESAVEAELARQGIEEYLLPDNSASLDDYLTTDDMAAAGVGDLEDYLTASDLVAAGGTVEDFAGADATDAGF